MYHSGKTTVLTVYQHVLLAVKKLNQNYIFLNLPTRIFMLLKK